MKGKYVERRFGWDCHGLPIEHEIDKQLECLPKMLLEILIKKQNTNAAMLNATHQNWRTISCNVRWVDFENDYKTGWFRL